MLSQSPPALHPGLTHLGKPIAIGVIPVNYHHCQVRHDNSRIVAAEAVPFGLPDFFLIPWLVFTAHWGAGQLFYVQVAHDSVPQIKPLESAQSAIARRVLLSKQVPSATKRGTPSRIIASHSAQSECCVQSVDAITALLAS